VYEGIEADDAIAIEATKFGDDSVIVSLDKDFDQVQGWHYNFVKKDKYYITHEEGLFNFYCQFLVGDRIDNIIGVQGIGPVKAKNLLEGKTEREMFDICVEKLGSRDRAIENGILLYLQRKEGEIWSPPSEDAIS
jgi:5'-3' exonuclease